jgi:predicted nucleic acid-binding Zn ribbon protein
MDIHFGIRCKRCGHALAVMDRMLEAYDLVCVRCGMRKIIDRALIEPPPCYQ